MNPSTINLRSSKKLLIVMMLLCAAAACHKDSFHDTSFAKTAASVSRVGVMFDITQDNTGLVTITPSGEAAASYDVFYGDTTSAAITVAPGKNAKHIYPEGNYTVKIVAHDLTGGTATFSQPLVVSYITPQDLKVTLSKSNLIVNVSATAKYATVFKMYFGDSANGYPVSPTSALSGQAISHTYTNAGTYVVKVVALSGGSETAQWLDTIHVATQISLPLTFEDPNTDYTMSDFGGDVSALSADPAGGGNHVMKTIKTAGAQTWAGTTMGPIGFSSPVPLTAATMRMSVRVYSPAAGLDIKLKIEDHNNGPHSVETDVMTTLANQWETLTFDFSHPATGTPAWNPTWTYDKESIFFDFNNGGTGSVFYFDDLKMLPASLSQIDLPVTFESSSVDYTMSDFGGNVSTPATDPVNGSNHVMQSVKTAGSQTWAGTTIGTALGFAHVIPLSASHMKMTVSIYSPAAGLDIKLKVEDHNDATHSVETDMPTTMANQWETLTFDFTNPAATTPAWNAAWTYDKASLFFDFNVAGSGKTFYWDNVIIL